MPAAELDDAPGSGGGGGFAFAGTFAFALASASALASPDLGIFDADLREAEPCVAIAPEKDGEKQAEPVT